MREPTTDIVFEDWKDSMTNYQFNYLIELKDKYEALTREADQLRDENAKLKSELEQTRKPTDGS